MVELLPNIVLLRNIILVGLHNIVHHLRVLFHLRFRNTIVGKHTLPVFGQALRAPD